LGIEAIKEAISMKITHAAGHGLLTSGKQSPDGFKEWSYTNEIVKLVMKELDNYEDVTQKRIDDPTGKVDYPLTVRSNMVNSFNGNLHIDYHMNAFGEGWTSPGGTETFVYKATLKEANALASKVQANLVRELCFANRGVKVGNLHMIRETKPTAILIEFAFMSNKDEAMKMRTAEYQKKAAEAVVDAIATQYKLKRKVVAPVSAPQTANTQGIGTLKVLEKTVIRDKATYLGGITGNVEPNGEYIVHDYQAGWFNIGGWVYSKHVQFIPHADVKMTR
jgi:N-acetylmuramoyl-L-alanine amidase